MQKIKAAIIGSGNIGTDLMIKTLRGSELLELACLVGIDPQSDGLARAKSMGIDTTAEGVGGLIAKEYWKDIRLIFDASSAKAHHYNWKKISEYKDKTVVDLTPAAIGPFLIPVVNSDYHLEKRNVNMVTCGGQATIPVVAAVNRVAKVKYGEIVASIASKSAGQGTRANIDEFTQTTARAIEVIGGAEKGKAIIILNPAEPPVVMRDTVFTLSEMASRDAIEASVKKMVNDVQKYVPGYNLHQDIQFDEIPETDPIFIEGLGYCHGLKTSVFLEVRGAGHYLPEYAGNLDIMTSAALATGEIFAEKILEKTPVI